MTRLKSWHTHPSFTSLAFHTLRAIGVLEEALGCLQDSESE